ncbi:DNA-directed DNA polymerase [Tanacetum coccineum]
MTETMEQYMIKTHGNYGSGVVRPKINDKTHFELKWQYLKELRENTFSGSEHEDANKHIEKVLEIIDLFHIPEVTQDQVVLRVFPMSLTGAASRWLGNEPSGLITNWETLRTKFLDKYCPPKWNNGTSSKAKSTKTSDRLTAIQAQLNNLKREIKKVKKKVYAAQVGCELLKGPHYTKDCPLKEEGNTLEEAYYTQFGAPYQPTGQYKVVGPGFYQRNNGNSSYPDRRQTLEESLTKFMAESAKRHKENSNIIKEIRASTDAAIRNQGASIKTLEIQIGQMSKVLQERGIGGLPGSTEPNPRDHVKLISTTNANSSEILPFPRQLQDYCCDNWREAQDVKILEAYDHTLPQKEKVPGSFTLLCFIYTICFDKAIVDLGASVSVMPFSTYTNLGLGILSHTRLTIELANRTIKQPRGIAENVLVRIGKFIFPIDFIILDIPEDDDVPLILEFIIIDDEDVTRDGVLGMPFFMKYVSCQIVMKKFTHRDKCPCYKEIEDMDQKNGYLHSWWRDDMGDYGVRRGKVMNNPIQHKRMREDCSSSSGTLTLVVEAFLRIPRRDNSGLVPLVGLPLIISSRLKRKVSDSGKELSKVLVFSKKRLGNEEVDLVTISEDGVGL